MLTKVRDIMTKHVISVDPDDRVEDVIGVMLRYHVSGVPVIDMADSLLGVITEFDLLEVVEDPTTDRNKVYHYMTRDVDTIDADMTILEVARAFRARPIRRFPVISDGKVVGIVSRREVIRHVREARIAHLTKSGAETQAEV